MLAAGTRAPARDINAPNTFGLITSTVSTARTVELVLKFFFQQAVGER